MKAIVVALMVFGVSATVAHAQSVVTAFNPRDDRYAVLGLVRVRSEYERIRAELARVRTLNAQGYLSRSELESREAEFARARVDYLQQALATVSAAMHVTIGRALKRRDPSGGITVWITLQNLGAIDLETATVSAAIDTALAAQLHADAIDNVFVSLRSEVGAHGAGISIPYEARIPHLNRMQHATVSFKLVRDVDELVVSVSYGGHSDEHRIALEPDAGDEQISVQSIQFSQEADLGTEATFDLRLRRGSPNRNGTIRLRVTRLPPEISYEFRDPATRARVTQMRFPDGESEKVLQFVVKLPDRESGSVKVDRAIQFAVHAGRDSASTEAGKVRDSAARSGNDALLELIARGTGKADVRAENLFHDVRSGDSARVHLTITNSGSRRLDGIRVVADAPMEWRTRAVPATIDSLKEGDTKQVDVVLVAPESAQVGDYEARIHVASNARGALASEEKVVRVHVSAPGNRWFMMGALTLVIVTVVGTVWLTTRLARR